MEKPDFRDDDEQPRRRSDMRLTLPILGTVEASGPTVVQVLLIIVLCLVVGLHHYTQDRQQDQIASRQLANAQRFTTVQEQLSENQDKLSRIVATFTCVLTLNESQRKEFRIEGRYCGDYETNKEVRAVIKPEAKR